MKLRLNLISLIGPLVLAFSAFSNAQDVRTISILSKDYKSACWVIFDPISSKAVVSKGFPDRKPVPHLDAEDLQWTALGTLISAASDEGVSKESTKTYQGTDGANINFDYFGTSGEIIHATRSFSRQSEVAKATLRICEFSQ